MGGRAPITAEGMWLGARLTVPLVPGIITFAAVFGTVCAQKGLTIAETMLINSFVFAGASQFVAMELYRDPVTPTVLIAMTGIAAAVNLRMLLLGASLRPWLGQSPAWQVYPGLYFLTDMNWLLALRYHADGGRDWGVYFGSGILLWLLWTVSVVPGYYLGQLFAEPQKWGLDLVMPALFITMLVPIWKGRRQTLSWLVAAVVAVASWQLIGGYWFVLTGAIAGAVAGAFIDDPEPKEPARG
ncbi:AzlC family ABC transporter permease [Pannonibacter carbonis]|uniref:AzlC family ABC transporter permease n=1 Tax=Pannonibacter carbonis TaxID=2067569 RepID=UPI001AD8C057|nr:AzlC family ABC transporter permease [Pannonibacter carbonis]